MPQNSNDAQGCLWAILGLFGIKPPSSAAGAGETALPYRMRDDFLSAAELSFFQVLRGTVGDQATVLAKVRISDILFVTDRRNNQGAANKIDRKHVDFLLSHPQTVVPLVAVELDDSSHQRKDRIERDEFVDAAFAAADVPLVRFPARRSYQSQAILATIMPYLTREDAGLSSREAAVSANAIAIPDCPKCDVAMVERQAKKGNHAGKRFYACPNYPKCRELVPID